MKLLLTTIAAVLVVGCGESQQSASTPEVNPAVPVAEAAQPKPPTAKAPDISIHDAAKKGNLEAVKQHLAAGTDLNAKNSGGQTALHVVARGPKKSRASKPLQVISDRNETKIALEIAKLLIDKGADVNRKIEVGVLKGETPLDWAIDWERTEIAELLRKHSAKSGVEYSIHNAAYKGNIEAVKQHIDAGEDVNAKDRFERSPLHSAAMGTRLGARKKHNEVVELLIAKGANVNAKDDNGSTPLHSADTKEIAELLIAKGADLHAKNNDGWTPLHFAADGRKEVVELLITKGADVNAKENLIRETPLDMAIGMDRTEIAALLRKHGGKTGEELKAEGK